MILNTFSGELLSYLLLILAFLADADMECCRIIDDTEPFIYRGIRRGRQINDLLAGYAEEMIMRLGHQIVMFFAKQSEFQYKALPFKKAQVLVYCGKRSIRHLAFNIIKNCIYGWMTA